MRLVLTLAPLLAFYAVESSYGLRPAIATAMALAAVDLGWTRWREGRWSRTTLFMAALVVGLGGVSLVTDPSLARLTPAAGDLVFAAALLGARLRGVNVLVEALREQDPLLDPHPLQVRFLGGLAVRLALLLLVHAALVVWAAGRDPDTWFFVVGPLQYAMLGVQIGLEVAYARWVILPRVEAEERGET